MKYPEKADEKMRLEAAKILWEKNIRKWYRENDSRNDEDVSTAGDSFSSDVSKFCVTDGYDICRELERIGWNGINCELVVLMNDFSVILGSILNYEKRKWVRNNKWEQKFSKNDLVWFISDQGQKYIKGKITGVFVDTGEYIVLSGKENHVIPFTLVKELE